MDYCTLLFFQMQERSDQGPQYVNTTQYPHPPPSQPVSNTSPHSSSRYQPTNNQKTNQVSAACSLPNLNHGLQNNIDPAYMLHNNNMQNSHLLEPSLNNSNININNGANSSYSANNSLLHGINMTNQPLASQIWNGQALNNQVAPGNRANNYWDNFRR